MIAGLFAAPAAVIIPVPCSQPPYSVPAPAPAQRAGRGGSRPPCAAGARRPRSAQEANFIMSRLIAHL